MPKPDYVSAPTRVYPPISLGWVVFIIWMAAELLLWSLWSGWAALVVFLATVVLVAVCAVAGARQQGRP